MLDAIIYIHLAVAAAVSILLSQGWIFGNRPFARKAQGMHTYVTSHPEYTALTLVVWIIY